MSLVLHKVLTQEPPPPRSVNPAVPRDLETICLKAIAKHPDGRYQTARDMAEDLRRFLRAESIVAQRPGRLTRLGRRLRKDATVNTSLAIALIAVFLSAFSFGRPAVEGNADDPALNESPGNVAVRSANGRPFVERRTTLPASTVRLATNPAGATV
jgi:hypothetical protein